MMETECRSRCNELSDWKAICVVFNPFDASFGRFVLRIVTVLSYSRVGKYWSTIVLQYGVRTNCCMENEYDIL